MTKPNEHFDQICPENGCISSHCGFHGSLVNADYATSIPNNKATFYCFFLLSDKFRELFKNNSCLLWFSNSHSIAGRPHVSQSRGSATNSGTRLLQMVSDYGVKQRIMGDKSFLETWSVEYQS